MHFRSQLGIAAFMLIIAGGKALAQTPTISGVQNGASFTALLAPGSLASLFGTNLSSSPSSCQASAGAWTTTLCNATVMVDNVPAPLSFVSASQINLQIPFGLAIGPASVVAVNQANQSTAFAIQLSAFSPGILQPSGIQDAAGKAIATGNPAVVSSGVTVYCIGLGVTNPAVAAGNVAPATAPFAMTVTKPVILIDGTLQIATSFSALAPNQVGFYQVNFIVPTLSPGSHTLAVQSGGVSSVAVPFFVAPLPFFQYEVSLGSGVYYQQFPDNALFGYYNYASNVILYHYDMGFEAFIPGTAADIYLYDFAAGHWFYTSATLFPDLYDFTLGAWIYYFQDTKNAGHYTTNPRYFSNLTTGMIFTM